MWYDSLQTVVYITVGYLDTTEQKKKKPRRRILAVYGMSLLYNNFQRNNHSVYAMNKIIFISYEYQRFVNIQFFSFVSHQFNTDKMQMALITN